MATILFTWELGQGYGHLVKIRNFGQALEERGHRIVVASQNVVTATELMPDHWPIYQAVLSPPWTPPKDAPKRTGSYAEILWRAGLGDVPMATALIRSWERLMTMVGADIVVAESSPMALAAAHGRIPSVVLGNTFSVPPAHLSHFPPLTPTEDWLPPHEATEAVLQAALEATGRPALPWLPALYRGDLRICDGIPHVDKYKEYRMDELYGLSTELLPMAQEPPSSRLIFAYINGTYRHFDELVAAIAGNADRFHVVMAEAPDEAKQLLRRRGVTVYDGHVSFAQTFPASRAILAHGNFSTTINAMAVGRPQILLPYAMERQITARYVESVGAGCILKTVSRSSLKKAIEAVADNRLMATRAREVAEELHRTVPYISLDRCADAIEETIRNAKS